MKKATSTLLTGSAAAVAIAVASFGALNAWFVSSPALAAHEAREDEEFAKLSVSLDSIHKQIVSSEKARRGESVRNTQDAVMLLESMGDAVPPEHIRRLELRLEREKDMLEDMQ